MLNKPTLYKRLISRRTFLIGIGKLGLLALLAARIFYMQIFRRDEYRTLSDKNRINLILLPPPRGQIYDAEGALLATNKTCFRLLLDKNITILQKNNKNYYLEELQLISRILSLGQETEEEIFNKAATADRKIPVVILDRLSWQQISIIEEYKPKLKTVFIDTGFIRYYPFSPFTSHLTGYLGRVSEQEKNELGLINSHNVNVGKASIEKYYEQSLKGEFGYRQMEVNAYGKYVREITGVSSSPGQDLHLNIDIKLQEKIYNYLNKQGCSVIVSNCNNGKVLIYASTPDFDANNFAKLSNKYWRQLIDDPYKPLLNKAVQSGYPPGSVFKLVTILAALESGISPKKIVNCLGKPIIGGNRFRCWNKGGHGNMDMITAIQHSCNYYIYEVARLIGADKIIEVADKFGFGQKTDIDLSGESAGFLPTRKWKKHKFKTNWTLGDTLNLSMGQGFLLATPIQLARFVTSIANGGRLYVPSLAANRRAGFEKINIDPTHLKIIKEAMLATVNSLGGTAYSSRILGTSNLLVGKTGTAQVVAKKHADDDLSRESVSWEKRNHASFIGFGPYHDPRYSIAVFVDHGGGGGKAAAPIAAKVMEEVFRKYL